MLVAKDAATNDTTWCVYYGIYTSQFLITIESECALYTMRYRPQTASRISVSFDLPQAKVSWKGGVKPRVKPVNCFCLEGLNINLCIYTRGVEPQLCANMLRVQVRCLTCSKNTSSHPFLPNAFTHAAANLICCACPRKHAKWTANNLITMPFVWGWKCIYIFNIFPKRFQPGSKKFSISINHVN